MTSPRMPSAIGARGGLAGAVASEWTKFWTVRSTRWLVLGSILLMAATAPSIGITIRNNIRDDGSSITVASGEVAAYATYYVVQLAVAALAMLVVTAEYSTGSIRSSLQAVPDHRRLLLAKCTVISMVLFSLGLVIGVIGVYLGGATLREYSSLPLPQTGLQVVAIAVYLALTGVITVCLGVIARSSAGTLTLCFLGHLAVPSLMYVSGFPGLPQLAQVTPSIAGQRFMLLADQPYPWILGLGILAAWTTVAFSIAVRKLRLRDVAHV